MSKSQGASLFVAFVELLADVFQPLSLRFRKDEDPDEDVGEADGRVQPHRSLVARKARLFRMRLN